MSLSEKHVPSLDGLRGLAILLVLVYHETILVPSGAFDRAFSRVARLGWCGVDLFFVLSGYLITGILLDSKGRDGYFRNFYARRILRIFPLYYALLIFTFFVLPRFYVSFSCDPAAFAGRKIFYGLYLGNYVMASQGGFWHQVLAVTWSLSIEEQFYLVWPVLVLVLSRRQLLRACIGIFAATLVVRALCVALGVGPVPVYVLTPLRLDGLATGAFFAVLLRLGAPPGIDRTARRAAALAAGLVLLIWALPDDVEWYGVTTQELGYSTLAVLFGALLVIAVRSAPGGLPEKILTLRPLRFLGKYSYAIYLFHFPLKNWTRSMLWGSRPLPVLAGSALPAQVFFYFASTALTVALAWLSWHVYERPFLRLKRFFDRDDPGGRARS